MTKVIGVRFKANGKSYYFSPGDLELQQGDHVIVETARGTECGEVAKGPHDVPDSSIVKPLKTVTRMADAVDVRRMQQNRADEKRAFSVCEERIAKHKLDMKLVDVEYTLDRNKILFYFTADGRIDFRDLVKDLAGVFRTRIELRQIGCSRFLRDFQPVSIKMAKEQGLSLNPAKISGSCGRLMCCLAYEQPAYEYLNRITPGVGSIVKTPEGVGAVVETNVISGTLRVRMDPPATGFKTFHKDECQYLRGGKRAPIAPDPEPEEITE